MGYIEHVVMTVESYLLLIYSKEKLSEWNMSFIDARLELSMPLNHKWNNMVQASIYLY